MRSRRSRRWSIGHALDGFFFVFAGAAAIWLAYLSLTETFQLGWGGVLMAVLFWGLLAYLALPRLHRILTAIYVPDYFMGRTRTSDGLLGDPVNLALQGEREQVEQALAAAGWIPADPVGVRSSWRIIASTLQRRSYPTAPVSPLFLFGRMQDLAYQQEVDGSPAQRHHVRLWRCPDGWLLPGGRRVDWLAAGTFDRAVGLSLFTLQVTHRIDADTDIERDHIVSTLTADPRVRLDVIRDFATGYHARNGGGDSITTDGDLPIVDVRAIAGAASPARPATSTSPAVAAGPAASVVPSAHGAPASHADGPDAADGSARDGHVRERRPRKRPAFEPVGTRAAAYPSRPADARPVTTVAGAILVLLRAAAGALWGVAVALGLPGWVGSLAALVSGDGDGSSADAGADAVLLLALVGVVCAVQVLFAVLLLFGSNVARVTVMVISVASIVAAFVGWWDFGQQITVRTSLIALSLDILVLLALSSRSAAAFARRRPGPRTGGSG